MNSSSGSVDYNVYRSSIISHLRLQGLKDNSDAYTAFSHWHPAVLELHRENRLKVAKMMFPRTLSLALGKEIGLTVHDKIQGDSCTPTTYFINVPSATFASYNDYLNTRFIDQQIIMMASGERPVPHGIRLSLSTSAGEKSAQDAPNLLRLSSVQQRSTFMSAELLYEERALVTEKLKEQTIRKKNEYASTVADMNETARKLFKKSERDNKSLKRQLEAESEKNDLLRKKNKEAIVELTEMKRIVSQSITRSNIVCPIWHENNPRLVPYWLGFINYTEFTTYHRCIWPDVVTVVHVKDGNITEFEKSIITKMFFRKGLEFELIGFIWGRTKTSS